MTSASSDWSEFTLAMISSKRWTTVSHHVETKVQSGSVQTPPTVVLKVVCHGGIVNVRMLSTVNLRSSPVVCPKNPA